MVLCAWVCVGADGGIIRQSVRLSSHVSVFPRSPSHTTQRHESRWNAGSVTAPAGRYGQFGAPSVCLPCSYGRCTHVHVGPRPATDGERACSRPTYHSLRLTAAAFNCAKRSMPPRFLIRIINYYTHRLGSVCFYDASFALGFTAV